MSDIKTETSTTESKVDPTTVKTEHAAEKSMDCPSAKSRLEPYYIGSHEASYLGANAFALFLKSQRQWNMKEITKDEVSKFKEWCQKKQIGPEAILPHASYLSNLGQPDDEKLEKSYNAFLGECQRAEELGLRYINIHPGSTTNKCEPKESIRRIASCINRIHKLTKSVVIVLENTAGAGNTIGISFEQLNEIIKQVDDKDRVGVCIDTCHAHASGFDLTSKNAISKLLDDFDKVIGIQFLKGMHLNDSMDEYAKHKDRHQALGKGTIGLETFRQIMNEDRCRGIPLILETPVAGKDDLEYNKSHPWAYEIELLRQLQGKSSVPADIDKTVKKILEERVDVIDKEEGKPKKKRAPSAKKSVTAKKTTKKAAPKPKGRGAPKRKVEDSESDEDMDEDISDLLYDDDDDN